MSCCLLVCVHVLASSICRVVFLKSVVPLALLKGVTRHTVVFLPFNVLGSDQASFS